MYSDSKSCCLGSRAPSAASSALPGSNLNAPLNEPVAVIAEDPSPFENDSARPKQRLESEHSTDPGRCVCVHTSGRKGRGWERAGQCWRTELIPVVRITSGSSFAELHGTFSVERSGSCLNWLPERYITRNRNSPCDRPRPQAIDSEYSSVKLFRPVAPQNQIK